MRRLVEKVIIAMVLSGLVGCSNSRSTPMNAESVPRSVHSEKERALSPFTSLRDMRALANGNNAFAFDLYQLLAEEDENVFYSPYSISLALAMTYAGARGETAQQMSHTLHFTLPQEKLHPAFNDLDLKLAQRGEGAEGTDGEGFRLNIVNAIWGQEGYEFLSHFLDTLAVNYGAGLRVLDFAADPEAARAVINNWVSDQTEDKIEELIPQGLIDRLTTLVLTNAIYFNAAWSTPFDPDLTEEAPFHLLDGSQVTVPMMRQTAHLHYAEGDGYRAVELIYDGLELTMTILIPQQGTFEDFEESLDAALVEGVLNDLRQRRVALSMPTFEFSSELSLAETLAEMGMADAFSGKADFSGMTGHRELFIQDVIHEAFVSVDEEGTEAAAATAVVMARSAMVEAPPVEVTMDRPFIFLIRDIETNTILFVGRVVDPSE